ncbi:MAG: carbon-nitrogen hydrolase family protein, partial [Paenibacillus sp.]|nr:carbon-nitrogen hydrolase family protein [Paenibacillus sp.]
MSNFVKVSCLSAPKCPIGNGADFETAVETVIHYWERQLEQVLPDQPDIIVLPEVCDKPSGSGFTTEWYYDFYRYRGNRVRDFFSKVAAQHRCYIAYSANISMPDGSFRNATQLIDRSGHVTGTYHKNHLTITQKSISDTLYGKDAPVFQTDFGRVACAICFDLNFDELREQYVKQRPDLILFSSAYHGGLMQQYWAYSCRAYFAGSVYVGNPCSILSPLGEVIGESTNYYHFVTRTINLDCAVIHIDYNSRHFRSIKQKYGSKVSIQDPG